jgi:hypothetical protein
MVVFMSGEMIWEGKTEYDISDQGPSSMNRVEFVLTAAGRSGI